VILIGVFVTFGAVEVVLQTIEYDPAVHMRIGAVASIPPLLNRATVAVLIWIGGLASLILSIILRSKIWRILRNYQKLLVDIGLLTYPIYLNHYVLGMTLVPALFAVGLPGPLVLVVSLASVVTTSWLIMKIPERRLQSILRSWLQVGDRRVIATPPF
jgi:peptidoglycan/LPS O-acetylase OafA/YrhL